MIKQFCNIIHVKNLIDMATKDITDADITDTVADIEKMSEFHGSLTHQPFTPAGPISVLGKS